MRQTWVGGFLFLALASCAAKGGSTGFNPVGADAGGADSAAPGVVAIKNATYTGGDGSMGYLGAFDHITFLFANDTDQDVKATSKIEIQAGAYDQSATFKAGEFCSQDQWLPAAHTSALVTLVPESNTTGTGRSTLDAQCAGSKYPTLFDTFVFPDATFPEPTFSGAITITLTGLFKDGSPWTTTVMGTKL